MVQRPPRGGNSFRALNAASAHEIKYLWAGWCSLTMHSQAPHSNCATACALESVSVVAAGVRAETAPRLIAYNYQMAGLFLGKNAALSLELRNCSRELSWCCSCLLMNSLREGINFNEFASNCVSYVVFFHHFFLRSSAIWNIPFAGR